MTLADIRQYAMDRVDEQTTKASGKFSVAWWSRVINRTKDVVAQRTGYNMGWQGVDIAANTRTYALPSTLCWGIIAANYWSDPMDIVNIHDQIADYETWRKTAVGTPSRLILSPPNFDLDPPPDRGVDGGTNILAPTAGSAFTNQPANDGVEVLSDTAGDTGRTVDIYGTTYRTGTVVKETVTLAGATVVSTTKTDWGDILGVEASATHATATVTIREASGNATITTIAAGATTSGVSNISPAGDGGKAQPTALGSAASTAFVGLVGTDEDAAAASDNAVALAGTSEVTFPAHMDTVTKVLLGAVASGVNVTIKRGYALYLLGGSLPADLVGETDIPTGLPSSFHWLLGEGAAAFASGADLYGAPQERRETGALQNFVAGLMALNAYIDSMGRSKMGAIRVDQSLYRENLLTAGVR